MPSPEVYFMGRWDLTTNMADPVTGVGANAEWPGSAVITSFTGPNITITLSETNGCAVGGCDTVTVEIDGLPVTSQVTLTFNGGAPTMFTPSAASPITLGMTGNTTILVSGLSTNLTHTVGVYKNTDSAYGGEITFGGFLASSAANYGIQTETYTFTHHIEWIGDDINAGTGDIGPSACTEPDTAANSEFESYARIVSEHFNAERYNLSVSQACVTAGDMPLMEGNGGLYSVVLPSEGLSSWDFATSTFDPDLVVINIGSYGDFNPYATDPGPVNTPYQSGLVSLITQVRSVRPAAYILLVSGLGWAGQEQPSEAEGWVQNALATYQLQAPTDTAISFYGVPTGDITGSEFTCGETYPTAASQSGLATLIENAIVAALPTWTATAWYQGR
jgi:hypothetical protein